MILNLSLFCLWNKLFLQLKSRHTARAQNFSLEGTSGWQCDWKAPGFYGSMAELLSEQTSCFPWILLRNWWKSNVSWSYFPTPIVFLLLVLDWKYFSSSLHLTGLNHLAMTQVPTGPLNLTHFSYLFPRRFALRVFIVLSTSQKAGTRCLVSFAGLNCWEQA